MFDHPRTPMRLGAALCLLLLLAAGALSARTDSHALVRVFLDGPQGQEFLLLHPGLDIALVKPGVYAEIVADAEDLALLRSTGVRMDVVHEDLEAFYRARMPAEKSDSFGVYHNYPEMVAFVDSLRLLYPTVVSEKWYQGTTIGHNNIWCFRMSDNPDVDEDEPEVLFDGGHHAREPMGWEFLLMFAEHLAQNYGTDPEITYLLDNREVYFVPIVNPDGVEYNDWGDMWRKNRRDNGDGTFGVDLNRNYPYEWGGPGSSGVTSDPDYRGPWPGSETETNTMMGLVNGHQFVTHNSYHTHGNLTLYPWGYTTDPSPDDAIFDYMAARMTMFNGYTPGQPGEVLYVVSGGSIDWMYGDEVMHDKVFSFSNEIGGPSDGFWPSEARRGDLFRDNIWPALYLMRAAAAYVDASEPVVLGGDGNGRLDAGEGAGLSLTLRNEGVTTAAAGVVVTLRTDDPYLQIGGATRTVGGIAAMGQTDLAGDPFPLAVDPACPTGHVIAVTATVTFDGTDFDYDFNLPVGEPILVFGDDLESGTGAWLLTGSWATTTLSSHSPTHSLTDSPVGDYGDYWAYSAQIDGTFRATSLQFWHKYAIEEDWDYGYVQVSTGGGWNTLATYTGFQNVWTQVTLPLDAYSGQDLSVRFLLESDGYITEDGWYVDDVVLYGASSDNLPPAAPALVHPAPGATVGPAPALVVANSYDPDGSDPLTYGFRVYADPLCTTIVAATDGVPEGVGETSWTVPTLANGTYWWRAYAADATERGLLGETRAMEVDVLSAVGDGVVLGPRLTALGPLTSGQARLQLSLAGPADVTLAVYDARGALVRRLQSGHLEAGTRVLTWDGRDDGGLQVASGVYFVRAVGRQLRLSERVLLVR